MQNFATNEIEYLFEPASLHRVLVPRAPLGAPLVAQSVFNTKTVSKVAPTCKQDLNTTPKSDPEVIETFKKLPKNHIWGTGPADHAKRLQ